MDTPALNGGRLLVGGALAVTYDADTNEVTTVLWAVGEPGRRAGPAGGRLTVAPRRYAADPAS